MAQFEYEITKYPAETFSELVYYCSEAGECSLDQVTHDQTKIFQDLLNERGWEGWELAQVVFGSNGVIAFWKRRLNSKKA